MTAYRLDGFSFNRDNLRGIDADALAGLNKFLNARERELNTVETESFICAGGPFDGQPIEVETLSGAQLRTAVLSVGKWTGFYEVVQGGDNKGHAAVWRGTDAPAADAMIPFYGPLRAPAKQAKRADLGRGFAQLGNLLASMGEEHEGDTVAFTIGRARFTVANTPEAIERLRARILKAKKWFADKLLQAPRAAQSAPDQVRDRVQAEAIERAAVQDVAQLVAVATAAAAIAHASTDSRPAVARQDAPAAREVATVGAASSEPARIAQGAILATGQAIGAPAAAPGCNSPADSLAGPYDVTHAARAVERLTNLWPHDAARRRAIDAGRDGDATALPVILAILLRIATHGAPVDQRAARDVLRQVRAGSQAPASEGPGPDTPRPTDPLAPIPAPPAAATLGDDSGSCKTSERLQETPQDLDRTYAGTSAADLDSIDLDTLTAAEVAQWPPGQVARLLDHLEDRNHHGECLTLRALHVGRSHLAELARAINREHQRIGSLTWDLSRERYTLSQRIRAAEAAEDPPPAQRLDEDRAPAPENDPPAGAWPAPSVPGPALPLRPDQVPPGSAWSRWRATITRFDEIFSMPIIDPLTGAELQTLREACGLSRDELGQLADVQARTIKHWENGRAGVPSDVAALVQRLDDTLHTVALDAIAGYSSRAAPAAGVVLIRYASAEDMHRYRPELVKLPASVHGAIVGRIRAGLRQLPGFADRPVRVVWLDPIAYDAWRQAAQLPDNEATRHAWAATHVRAQAIPHRADQPPPS